jgi:hypothetical protein
MVKLLQMSQKGGFDMQIVEQTETAEELAAENFEPLQLSKELIDSAPQ